jgi:hypothetical protein
MMPPARSIVQLAALFAAGVSTQASAETLSFYCITPNASAECLIGASQLRVEATDNGDGRARFVFTNTGPAASSITDVYFDDGTLLGISQVINGGPGVDFSQGASPGNLPGGNALSPAFETTAGFSADSNPPVQPNGVNPGESLTILFFLMRRHLRRHRLGARQRRTADRPACAGFQLGKQRVLREHAGGATAGGRLVAAVRPRDGCCG